MAGAVDRNGDVYAFDVAQNEVATILKFVPLVPQTSIKAHPSSTVQIPTVTFRFNSSIPRAEFQCQLRKAGANTPTFQPCSSPQAYDGLADGSYRFQVRSISPVGPVDPTPATFRFSIKLLHPDTAITSGPASTIGVDTATFAFESSSAGASFACRLERAGSPPPAFKPCKSPATYGQLANGDWTFEVQSSSTHGVADPTQAHDAFIVDTTPPTVTAPTPPVDPGWWTAPARPGPSVFSRAGQRPTPTALPQSCSTRSSSAAERVLRTSARSPRRSACRTCWERRPRSCRWRREARTTNYGFAVRTNLGSPPRAPRGIRSS